MSELGDCDEGLIKLKQETHLEIPITKGVIKLTRTIWSQSMSCAITCRLRFGLNKLIGEINSKDKQRLESPTPTEHQY